MKLVTADQMRALEGAAVAAGTPLSELMEQAGLAVAQEAWLSLGVVAGRRVLVLVGPGDNGGDGLVAARYLADWEADVAVYLLRARADDDANLVQLRERDAHIFVAPGDGGFLVLGDALANADLVIDALLGIGARRAIDGDLAEILRRLQSMSERKPAATVIAVDLPTGVDADSGRADALAVHADITVTFGLAKVGLYALPGSEYAGRVEVVDIGIAKAAADGVTVELLGTPWVRERLPKRAKSGNKGTFGRVLAVAGSRNYAGAARLCAEACYRAGAGLVTVACPASIQPMLVPALAEATWLPLPDDGAGQAGVAAADAIVDALTSSKCLLIGPGLGQSAAVVDVMMRVLRSVPANVSACVIDADALNVLATQQDWHESMPAPCVLTPHPGEMARLLGSSIDAVQDDRLNVAQKAAAKWRQVVVLKGAHTIVAAPDGRAAISPHANPLLATGGTGDVLAGAIAGLLAQGMAPFDAAACGVYVHGLAAEELSEELGDRGLLASELLPALPRAIRTILHGKRLPAAGRMPEFGGLGALGMGVGDPQAGV